MVSLKAKQLKEMGKDELEKKLKELKLELVKSKANTSKTGSSKVKEIKKMIARILTINSINASKKEVLNKK